MLARQPDFKPLFTPGPSLTAKLLLLIMVSIALMTVDHYFDYLNLARATLGVAVYPLQYAVNLPGELESWATNTLGDRGRLAARNRALHRKNLRMSARLLKYTALKQENTRLRKLLDTASKFQRERMLVAGLLSVDLSPYRQQIVIDKGTREGVYVGQPVLEAKGIAGQVTAVNPVSATAILITDPDNALPVQVNRNGLRTLAVGTGSPDTLDLVHIPANADIRHGDVVSTSGLGGRYPADYPVGRIARIQRPAGKPFARVQVRPFGLVDRSREVLLLWTHHRPVVADSGT